MHKGYKARLIRGIFIFSLAAPTCAVAYLAYTSHYSPSHALAYLRLISLILFTPIFFKFGLQLLIAPWYPLVEFAHSKRRRARLPNVSVLIPAWNEERGIKGTL